jgi:acyl-CoA dehydrogenase
MGAVLAVLIVGYLGSPFFVWAPVLWLLAYGFGMPMVGLVVLAGVLLLFLLPPLRQHTVSRLLMRVLAPAMPKISKTERTALDAGVVWAEAELFSGRPDFRKLMQEPYGQLNSEEKQFLDTTVQELCEKLDDWKIWNSREIPAEALDYINRKGFLGMIIPKKHGGLEFSALGHGDVIAKVATRSAAASITVMVPNSLGPAELLNHYGTEKQKADMLPKLARGELIPCFGLTEPLAGSDAGSITSSGVLFRTPEGKVKIRLNWQKRWITLAAISDVIGLAFRLRDPDNLLGKGEDVGITTALIPSETPGVVIGRRHDPLGVPFYNCPTDGHDVVVDAEESIIGGLANAGRGWEMLMDSLSAGRGISLPSQSAGGLKHLTRVTSAHASIRKQFGVPIGKFEGIEEPLAEIAASAYWVDALRRYILAAVDRGVKPPVVTAIAKYYTTEAYRRCVNHAMDIMGGAGISMGPKNLIAGGYIGAPIAVTVEGANIMTRTLIIFGQGALRAHPFVYKQVKAIEADDLKGFDRALWSHIGHVVRNMFRTVVLDLTRGWVAGRGTGGAIGRDFQRLAWVSARFALFADIAMAFLGGSLKMKEKLTGRYADILSWMMIATSTLRRWEAEGRRTEDLPFVRYSIEQSMLQIQRAFEGILANFEAPMLGPVGPLVAWVFRVPLRFLYSLNSVGAGPSDRITHEIADLVQQDTEQRDRMTDGIYLTRDTTQQIGLLEMAFKTVKRAEPLEKKIQRAMRKKIVAKKKRLADALPEVLEKGVLTKAEADIVELAERLRWEAIQVDDFSQDEYVKRNSFRSAHRDLQLVAGEPTMGPSTNVNPRPT